ncbi:MAG: AraC family transcriptional regulator [Eubacteriales bacterium]|nr:AraC family transcriptional regulator [Eubacteriales bacterium]
MEQPKYDVRIKELMNDLSKYMTFLTVEKGLTVSIHQLDTLVDSFVTNLHRYNHHLLPYCLCIKQCKDSQEECRLRQVKLFENIGEKPFFGTCWAGVGEYVFPIPHAHGGGRGFISVSGYKGDPAKTAAQMPKISKKYGIALADMQNLYAILKDEPPSFSSLETLIKPLVHMLTLLLMYLDEMNAHFPPQDTASSHLFNRITQKLRYEYDTDYSLEDLAEEFSCSVSHISHLFSKHAGCSYRTYINTMRTNMAKVFLTSTRMTVQEISDHLGFANSNYFSTVFRRMCGISPRDYRRRMAGGEGKTTG